MFQKELKKRGLTLEDAINRLKDHGVTEDFSNLLDNHKDDAEYKNGREFYAADNGLRTAGELHYDTTVGNLQEALFLLNNKSFERNPAATKGNNDDITKAPDFIFTPNGTLVEFMVNYSPKSGNIIKFQYRDGGFKYFLNEDKVMLVYFINENKVGVIGRSNCALKDADDTKDARIYAEHITSQNTGKPMDVISVKFDSLIDYDMFGDEDNAEIEKRVEEISNKDKNTSKHDWKDDKYYRSVGETDKEFNINLKKDHATWKADNKNMMMRKWKELVKKANKMYTGKNDSVKKSNYVRSEYEKFAKENEIDKYANSWIPQFSKAYPID